MIIFEFRAVSDCDVPANYTIFTAENLFGMSRRFSDKKISHVIFDSTQNLQSGFTRFLQRKEDRETGLKAIKDDLVDS